MNYKFRTVNDMQLSEQSRKLRQQLNPGAKTLYYVLIPVLLALCVAFAVKQSFLLSAVFGICAAMVLFVLRKIRLMEQRDADGLHRTVTFSGDEIVLSVQESGNTYQFFREDLQAAVFSDQAGLLYLRDAAIAVSADGFEEGTFADFRADMEAQTAEKTEAYRKECRKRTICLAVSCLLCVIISLLFLLGVFSK